VGVRDRLHADLLGLLESAAKLDADVIVDAVQVRSFSEATGRSPWTAAPRQQAHLHARPQRRAPGDADGGAKASVHKQILATRRMLSWLGMSPTSPRGRAAAAVWGRSAGW
jgi:hypothetical protein